MSAIKKWKKDKKGNLFLSIKKICGKNKSWRDTFAMDVIYKKARMTPNQYKDLSKGLLAKDRKKKSKRKSKR